MKMYFRAKQNLGRSKLGRNGGERGILRLCGISCTASTSSGTAIDCNCTAYCYVKPKVEMKSKGNAAYNGKFGSLEEARTSDKVICLVPSGDGRMYELCKLEQGEFIAPKNKIAEFPLVRAGFTPALTKIPAKLMGEIIGFFQSFMSEGRGSEALALIYWDKVKKEFLAYVPKQTVCKVEIEADLRDCPYDDAERYICYADINSHNSMDAFFLLRMTVMSAPRDCTLCWEIGTGSILTSRPASFAGIAPFFPQKQCGCSR